MKEFFKGVMHMTIEEMKEKKREHGYTYNMMSQMSGVPLGTVQKIFTGETKSPRYDTLEALARIFENGDRDYLYADMVEDSGTAYAAKVQGQYTLDDYYALPEDRRVELIDGCIYDMAAPSTIHQLIAGEVHRQISNFILEMMDRACRLSRRWMYSLTVMIRRCCSRTSSFCATLTG